MNNIDDILEHLQSAEQPVIDNPDELTERIMKSLDSTDSNSKVTTLSLVGRAGGESFLLPFVRAVLSLAALWIIGFFIYLQFDTAQPIVKNELLPGGREGASTLREVYKKRLCADCKNTISYTQLRSKLYENK